VCAIRAPDEHRRIHDRQEIQVVGAVSDAHRPDPPAGPSPLVGRKQPPHGHPLVLIRGHDMTESAAFQNLESVPAGERVQLGEPVRLHLARLGEEPFRRLARRGGRQSRSGRDLVDGHVAESTHTQPGSLAGHEAARLRVRPAEQPAAVPGHLRQIGRFGPTAVRRHEHGGPVLHDERVVQLHAPPQGFHLGQGLAGHQHHGDASAGQEFEPAPCGGPGVGLLVQQRSVQIGEHHPLRCGVMHAATPSVPRRPAGARTATRRTGRAYR